VTGERPSSRPLSDEDYRAILAFRDQLRSFLVWSEQRARAAGLTPAQHQLLLAVRGHPAPRAPTIGELAAHLLLRHHSVVGLVDRAQAAGLVERRSDPHDRRIVRIALTPAGEQALAELTAEHLRELSVLAEMGAAVRGRDRPSR
jgi:DNA-binding MarR family transcriptional regulator